MSNRQATLASELEADLYLPTTSTKDEPPHFAGFERPASVSNHAHSNNSLFAHSGTPAAAPQLPSRRYHEHVKSLSPYEGGMHSRPAS